MQERDGTDKEARKQAGVQLVYRNDRIAVFWEPKLCIHVGNCFLGLPRVFRPQARPWILPDEGTPDEIARVVLTCPTGALHFERLDGGAQEQPEDETVINPRINGPLFVRGKVQVVGPGGRLIREDTRLALCRCGHSENKPFCDGTHRRIGFQTHDFEEKEG